VLVESLLFVKHLNWHHICRISARKRNSMYKLAVTLNVPLSQCHRRTIPFVSATKRFNMMPITQCTNSCSTPSWY